MDRSYIEDRIFEKSDFTEQSLQRAEYESCTFIHCDFSGSDLSGIRFISCSFEACNLSSVNPEKTAFQDVRFLDCKMLGMRFDQCNPFGLSVRFERCILHHAVFYGMSLKKTTFSDCGFLEADFTDADLAGSVFERCDLQGATFDNTNLEKADMRTAVHYALDPERNRIRKARFAGSGLAGLLGKYDIAIDPKL